MARTFGTAFNVERAKKGCSPVNLLKIGGCFLSDRDIVADYPGFGPVAADMTEVDPDGRLQRSGTTLQWYYTLSTSTGYFYLDLGAGGITGDFQHRFGFYRSLYYNYWDRGGVWALTNTLTDYASLSAPTVYLLYYYNNFYLFEKHGASTYTSASYAVNSFQMRYITIERDTSVGTYGTLYCRFYSDAARTSLLSTISLTLHANTDYRYLMAAGGHAVGGSTGYLCGYQYDFEISPRPNQSWDGKVKSWGFVDTAIGQAAGRALLGQVEMADLRLGIINSGASPFADNFAGTPFEACDVELYQWFDGLSDVPELIFKGTVYGQPEYDLHECRLTARSIWQKYADTVIGEDQVITAADFSGADPDDIARMLPICYGDVAKAPFRAIDAGIVTTLAEDITASSPGNSGTLDVSDERFDGDTNFTIQIGAEQIRIASATGNTLTLASSGARGYNSTSAASHDKGAAVAEVKTEYVYAMAHPVKQIDNVYIRDRATGRDLLVDPSDYTAYTGQSGDQHATYTGRAVIAFSVLPEIRRQVAIDVEVSTQPVVGVSTQPEFSVAGSQRETFPNGHTGSAYCTTEANAYNGNENDYAQVYNASFQATLKLQFPSTSYGTVTKQWFWILADATVAGAISVQEADGTSLGTIAAGSAKGWFRFESTDTDWSEGVWIVAAAGESCRVYEVKKVVEYTPPATRTTDAAASRTTDAAVGLVAGSNSVADTVVGGQVLVDLDGYRDDGSGTYTGTANALIEQPDHVFRHILAELLGWPAADIDDTSFNATGTTMNGIGYYAFSLVIDQPVRAGDRLASLALQCRSRFLVTPQGKAKLILRNTGLSSAHSIAKNEIVRDSVRIRHTPTSDLINDFKTYYDRDNGKPAGDPASYRAVYHSDDSTSIGRYGTRHWTGDPAAFMFDAVVNSSMVAAAAGFLEVWHRDIRKMPILSVFLDNCEIEPGDLIDITHDLDSMSGEVVEVLKVVWKLGSGRRNIIDHLELTTVEN